MKIGPRHIAALQYSVIAAFLLLSWYSMLYPLERSMSQLEFVFAEDYERRPFFVAFAVATIAAVLVAAAFWFKRSGTRSFASALLVLAAVLLGLALWQFDTSLVFAFGLGFALALWSWWLSGGRHV